MPVLKYCNTTFNAISVISQKLYLFSVSETNIDFIMIKITLLRKTADMTYVSFHNDNIENNRLDPNHGCFYLLCLVPLFSCLMFTSLQDDLVWQFTLDGDLLTNPDGEDQRKHFKRLPRRIQAVYERWYDGKIVFLKGTKIELSSHTCTWSYLFVLIMFPHKLNQV